MFLINLLPLKASHFTWLLCSCESFVILSSLSFLSFAVFDWRRLWSDMTSLASSHRVDMRPGQLFELSDRAKSLILNLWIIDRKKCYTASDFNKDGGIVKFGSNVALIHLHESRKFRPETMKAS
jgi:hypothetical protein